MISCASAHYQPIEHAKRALDVTRLRSFYLRVHLPVIHNVALAAYVIQALSLLYDQCVKKPVNLSGYAVWERL